MPTICDMIQVDLPEGVQGRSLWPLLTGKDYPKEEFSSVWCSRVLVAFILQTLKNMIPTPGWNSLKRKDSV